MTLTVTRGKAPAKRRVNVAKPQAPKAPVVLSSEEDSSLSSGSSSFTPSPSTVGRRLCPKCDQPASRRGRGRWMCEKHGAFEVVL